MSLSMMMSFDLVFGELGMTIGAGPSGLDIPLTRESMIVFDPFLCVIT